GILHTVEVLETSTGTMPMTFGIVRPAVFMPLDAAEWSEERRRMVLLHELAHVRRGDAATQWLARMALILNWWNPLAWTAWREFLKNASEPPTTWCSAPAPAPPITPATCSLSRSPCRPRPGPPSPWPVTRSSNPASQIFSISAVFG